MAEALVQNGSQEEFQRAFQSGCSHAIKAADIQGDAQIIDEDRPIFGCTCVCMGKLERFTRAEAMQIVADLGSINQDGVTKTTRYLILGNNDYCSTIKDGKSNKQKKAEKLALKGTGIEILPETAFYEMLGKEFLRDH